MYCNDQSIIFELQMAHWGFEQKNTCVTVVRVSVMSTDTSDPGWLCNRDEFPYMAEAAGDYQVVS